jgi:Tfp pilus tip-associated adhesin PilY1
VLNSDTGAEQAAFMPRRSMSKMLNFADEAYQFEYVLDGPVTEHDVFDNRLLTPAMTEGERWRAWRQLAIGTGGRGERLIYGTNAPFKPGITTATASRVPDRQDFLWETGPDNIDAADGGDVKMGYITNTFWSGQNEIVGAGDDPSLGRWIVAINNGHYNGNTDGSQAGLIVLDARTGDVIRTIPLPADYPAGRGLSGVTLVRDYDGPKRVVAAYAGDDRGQLWRFNLMGNPNEWNVSYGRPLFTVPNNRPIYGAPAWRSHPSQPGMIVVFATGIALDETDLADQGAQSIYGIWDPMSFDGVLPQRFSPFNPVQEADLLEQTVLPGPGVERNGITYHRISNNRIDWRTRRGWRMPMTVGGSGERSIADAVNFSTSVLIVSTQLTPPTPGVEMCTATNQPGNCVYLLNAEDAAARRSRSFDADGDGRLDEVAVACIPQGGFSRGVAVIKRATTADGTPLPLDETNSPPITGVPGDPLRTRALDRKGNPVVNRPPGEEPVACEESRFLLLGSLNTSLEGGVTCPTSGWNRTQFQLSAPPKNE